MSDVLDRVDIDDGLNESSFDALPIETEINDVEKTTEARSKHRVHLRCKQVHSELRVVRQRLPFYLDINLPLVTHIGPVLKDWKQDRGDVPVSDASHHHLETHLNS